MRSVAERGLQEVSEVDILIDHGIVITVDPSRRVFADGAIAIRGNRIIDVGRRDDVVPRYRAARIIDGRHKVITPGLIQVHVHVSTEQALLGVLPDTMPPSQWVRNVTRFYALTSPEEEAINATATFLELLRTGTTCFIEAGTIKHPTDVIAAMGKVGIRGCVGRWTWDIPTEPHNLYQTTEEALASTEALIRDHHGAFDGRVQIWASPIGHTMTSDELLIRLKDLADRYETGMTMHLSSWLADVEGYLERTGHRPVRHLKELNILGSNLLLAHMVHLDADEVEAVLESGVNIAHCPTTAGWFGYGLSQVSQFPEMMARGATIGLGCDAKCCSNNLDVVRAMYTSAVIFRDARRSMDTMSAEHMLEMATLHGARCALQEHDLGSLEIGKKADVVLFDARRPEWRPVHNPVANLVFAADGHSVDTVLVDGKLVCERGRVTTVDEESVYEELESVGRSVLARAGWDPPIKWPVIQ